MNVPFDKINTDDAAKRIGVDYATVANWCKRKLINCENVSGGTGKARYMISEDEVNYLKSLQKQYGTKKILLYYKKDWNTKADIATTEFDNNLSVSPDEFEWMEYDDNIFRAKRDRKEFLEQYDDADDITETLEKIKKIKHRLAELEDEKNTLQTRFDKLRQKIIDII